MSRPISKLAPAAVVLVVAAWCCWPYLEGPKAVTGVEQQPDLPRITRSQLSPEVQPASERDPFRPVAAEKADSPQGEESPPSSPLPVQEKAAEQQKDITEILSGLVLGATYVQGDRRVALINGRVYQEGERLAIATPLAEPCVVAGISADRVLLLHRGRTVELIYPDPAFGADPTTAVEQRHE